MSFRDYTLFSSFYKDPACKYFLVAPDASSITIAICHPKVPYPYPFYHYQTIHVKDYHWQKVRVPRVNALSAFSPTNEDTSTPTAARPSILPTPAGPLATPDTPTEPSDFTGTSSLLNCLSINKFRGTSGGEKFQFLLTDSLRNVEQFRTRILLLRN